MDFADIVRSIADQSNRISFHYVKVTAKTNGNTRISVLISGSSTAVTGIRYLRSYSPQLDDIVVLLVNKGDIIALGDLD
jgi:hypothetical protein